MQIYIVLLLHVCSCNVYAATTLVPGKRRNPGLKRKSNQTIEAAQGRFFLFVNAAEDYKKSVS